MLVQFKLNMRAMIMRRPHCIGKFLAKRKRWSNIVLKSCVSDSCNHIVFFDNFFTNYNFLVNLNNNTSKLPEFCLKITLAGIYTHAEYGNAKYIEYSQNCKFIPYWLTELCLKCSKALPILVFIEILTVNYINKHIVKLYGKT